MLSFILSKREKGAMIGELYQRFPDNRPTEVESLLGDMEQDYLIFKKGEAYMLL